MPQLNRDQLHRIAITLNGREVSGFTEPRMLLTDFLRQVLSTNSVHVGCEHGVCGACTILVDGSAIRSCLMLAVQADGANLMTVEGLAEGPELHPLQRAFQRNHALQCGFCTPGLLMTAYEFLRDTSNPTDEQVREGISGNICRCTGYQNIVKAVETADRLWER